MRNMLLVALLTAAVQGASGCWVAGQTKCNLRQSECD